jgi:hypothetical protein
MKRQFAKSHVYYMYLRKWTNNIFIIIIIIIIISGSAAQGSLWPPRPRGLLITHNEAPQSVGMLLEE